MTWYPSGSVGRGCGLAPHSAEGALIEAPVLRLFAFGEGAEAFLVGRVGQGNPQLLAQAPV